MKRLLAMASAIIISVGMVSTAQAASYSFSTANSPFGYGPNSQGWWSENLGGTGESNVYAGHTFFNTARNFFTFDLSGLSLAEDEKVVSASLSGLAYSTGGVTSGVSLTVLYTLFDVSTDAETLNKNDSLNLAIYDDLGTGNSYGNREFSNEQYEYDFEMSLNELAFLDIMGAQGGYFSIGGAATIFSESGEGYIFGSSGETPYSLSIETQISAVPLPAALPLYGAGLAVLGFVGWRKKRKAA